jgi:predicted secreted protein
MRSIKTATLGLILASLLATAPIAMPTSARAAEPLRYNVVELQSSAEREVANNTMNAVLYVEQTDANAQNVANVVNRALAEGLRLSKDYPLVKVRSGNLQTTPMYSGGSSGRAQQLTGWRGRGELRLETRDFATGAALIGKLQAGMQLAGISFSVSPESRKKAEDELISEAIGAFKSRAELVKGVMGGRGYKIQRMGLSTGYSGPPRPVPMMAMAKSADASFAPPVEGGNSMVNVQVNGAIEVE